ncbi:polysaccharide deacetylase family protein [Gaoshiqia sediminis]|uniref:Polysaccharide deacetylase family protein n=1 Tax=Gaoshiqia sediminis TaxID=2986998 RepID=A0AA42C803_9BACT|nr:polysaccharide deacetylase family protein [Gaoshiqia sediminis]MCW0484114.1 polysaccharide deacetylase family protein [Gaoshiqia sediminis]
MKIYLFFVFAAFILLSCNKEPDTVSKSNDIYIKSNDVRVKICKWKNNHISAASFTWDDNNWTIKDCSEIFERYDYTCTFFVNPSGYMSAGLLSDLIKVNARNFEIGDHSASHARLDTMGIDGLNKEIVGAKNKLLDLFGYCYSFAYPFHLRSELSDEIVKDTHIFCRNFFVNNNDVVAWGNNSDNTLQSRINAIDESQVINGWALFGGHGLDEAGYNPIPDYELDSLLSYVSHKDIWVDTFTEIAKYYTIYKLVDLKYGDKKIVLDGIDDCIALFYHHNLKSCIISLSFTSSKEITLDGQNIIDTEIKENKDGYYTYIVNVDIMNSNEIKIKE